MDTELSFFQKLRNKLSVHRENNPGIFVFMFIIVINIIMIALSSGLLLLLPENAGRTFPEMMRFAFTLMVNPSGRYQYSDYPISLIVTTVVVLLGMARHDFTDRRYSRFRYQYHYKCAGKIGFLSQKT